MVNNWMQGKKGQFTVRALLDCRGVLQYALTVRRKKNKEQFTWHWKLLILGPVGLIITLLASKFPQVVENLYSNGLQIPIRQGLSLFFGLFPFSVAEIVVTLFLLFIIFKFVLMVKCLISGKWDFLLFLKHIIRNILIFISLFYFILTFTYGLAYFRYPFSRSAELTIRPYSLDDLEKTAVILIDKANSTRNQVKETESGVMKLPGTQLDTLHRSPAGYNRLSNEYPQFKGNYGDPKNMLYSGMFIRFNVAGIYSTVGESLVCNRLPDVYYPHTVSHELAHQRGIANEEDANFVGYLACINHPDSDFQYSGYFTALNYVLGAISREDRTLAKELAALLHPSVIKDMKDARNQMMRYQSPLTEVGTSINDAYLKSRLVSDGTKSYGRFVDLLVAESLKKIENS